MIETEDLILAKGKFMDWKDMYENVWSKEECCRYMFWELTENEEDAKDRMNRTIAFQKEHDAYTVYEKSSGKAIGFAGFEKVRDGVYEESGICIGTDYSGKGYGKQILKALIDYAKKEYDAEKFIYHSRKENTASIKLAESLGFEKTGEEESIMEKDGKRHILNVYSFDLK